MNKLETLVVPEDLGAWLGNRRLGNSRVYFNTINALYNYWDIKADSPTGNFISKNKKELIEVILGTRGYRIEKPVYHALIKGHELAESYDIYWNYDKSDSSLFISRLHPLHDNFITEMSKLKWIELGINDSNADFVEVDEKVN